MSSNPTSGPRRWKFVRGLNFRIPVIYPQPPVPDAGIQSNPEMDRQGF
jgi:hypothetical protein